MVRLRVVQSPDDEAVGRLLEVGTDEVIVGRSSEAGVSLADPSVSSQHVAIRAAGSGVQVRDLGSRNGVRVNGQLVVAAALGPGDEMTLGHTTLQVEEPTRPIPLSPPPAQRPQAAAAPAAPTRRVWPVVVMLLGLALLAAAGVLAGRYWALRRQGSPAAPSRSQEERGSTPDTRPKDQVLHAVACVFWRVSRSAGTRARPSRSARAGRGR